MDPLALAIFITVYILIVSQRWTGLPVWTSMMAGLWGWSSWVCSPRRRRWRRWTST